MIKCTFDAATLVDAVTRAARVAPAKGASFDKAAGIVMEIDPVGGVCVLKSTDLEVTYLQRLTISDCKGMPTTWRLPSAMLAGLMSNLNLQGGATVTFKDPETDGAIRISAGTMNVKLAMISAEHYPEWEEFDTGLLVDANDLAQKVSQVAWCTVKQDTGVLAGIHIDGESLIACDRNTAALVPCKVNVDHPITVPLGTLAAILRQSSDVRLAAVGDRLHLALDAETQATTTIYAGDYPNVKNLRRDNFAGRVAIPRQKFADAMNRLLVVGRADRMPTVKLTMVPGLVRSMVLDLEVQDTGRIQDTIEVGGDFNEAMDMYFTPSIILPAIENSKADMVIMDYGVEGATDPKDHLKKAVKITDDRGYEVLAMPRMP